MGDGAGHMCREVCGEDTQCSKWAWAKVACGQAWGTSEKPFSRKHGAVHKPSLMRQNEFGLMRDNMIQATLPLFWEIFEIKIYVVYSPLTEVVNKFQCQQMGLFFFGRETARDM